MGVSGGGEADEEDRNVVLMVTLHIKRNITSENGFSEHM